MFLSVERALCPLHKSPGIRQKGNMQNGQFELSVLVDGHPVREFGLTGRTYVEGRRNAVYTLRFRNNSPNRVLIVPSVDGLNTVDGQPATDASRGYVVSAYAAASIEGWRTSLNDVACFMFAEKNASYSAKSQGTPVNCGVIGVKVFAEKLHQPSPQVVHKHHHHHHYDGYPPVYPIYPRPWRPWTPAPYEPWWGTTGCATSTGTDATTANYSATIDEASTLRSATGAGMMDCKAALNATGGNQEAATRVLRSHGTAKASATIMQCSLAAATPDFKVGTAWGQAKADRVSETPFERAACLGLLEIFYTDAKSLAKVGIDVKKAVAVSAPLPRSFGGFCQPPK